jgi:hypothetical protein
MGWTYGWNTRDELVQELTRTHESEQTKHEVIKRAFAGNNLWTVVEVADKAANKSERHIVLFKLAKHGHWGYKDIGEECGPCEENCPLSFFDLAPLADDDNSYARGWRDRVRQYHARRNQKLTVGQEVKLTNGQTFRITHLHPLRGEIAINGFMKLYRIPRTMLTLPEPEPVRSEQSVPDLRVA